MAREYEKAPHHLHECSGRHAVITGGGSGICQRIAERFAGQGARVSVIGRSADKLRSTTDLIVGAGGEADGFPTDVLDYDGVANALASAVGRFGKIDVMINGAAGNFPSPAELMSSNGFKAVMDIDAVGTFNVCRAAFDHLTKPGAVILNMSAIQAIRPSANQLHVNAAKAAVDMITRTLALEWGPKGIRINSIAPGPVGDTEGFRRLNPDGYNDEASASWMTEIPLQRVPDRDEIADLAIFLASDAAKNITGQVFLTDGGLSLVGYKVSNSLE